MFALRFLWRDWRSGELTLLLASLVIAVATVTTITIFVDRLQQALERDSATFLAADRVIQSRDPIAADILEEATRVGLEQAQTLSFLTMAFSEDRARLSAVKAVSEGYPLRGSLSVAEEPFTVGSPVGSIPRRGEVWVESRLLPLIEIEIGEPVDIGFASFIATRVLVDEPDRGGGFNNAGPRVLMNLADVPVTEVVQPGSRLTYRYLFAGNAAALRDFEASAKPRLPEGARMFDVKESSESIGKTLDRAEQFLLLGGLLGVVLAGIAVALSAQRYSLRHYDHVAILKTLGATPATVDGLFLTMFVALGLVATLAGSALGFLVQIGIVEILRPNIPLDLPAPGIGPLWVGLTTGLVCLLAFALPPILRLRATEPIRVIRRNLGEEDRTASWLAYAAAAAGMIALMWWYTGHLVLTLMAFSGALVVVVVFSALALLLLRSGRALGMRAGSAWRLALAGMRHRGRQNITQILVFGLAMMLLLILYLLRTTLIQEWQAQVPDDAPNHFAINIAERDLGSIQDLLRSRGLAPSQLYALVYGSITNVATASGESWKPPESHNDGSRVFTRGLTAVATLPPDNAIVSGAWWAVDHDGPPLVSVEDGYAEEHNLALGDVIDFSIGEKTVTAAVASIRSVIWENLQPNFFFLLSPGALDEFPSTFVTSFRLEADQKLFLNDLLRAHPTVTVIEVDAIIRQIETIIDRVTLATELVLVLILASAGLVLLASIQASMDDRIRQQAILRTLGAGRRLIMGSLAIEFGVLGLFAGLVAATGAEITVFFLETQVFDLDYSVNPAVWLLGPLIGTLLIGAAGTAATVRLVRTSPTEILREVL